MKKLEIIKAICEDTNKQINVLIIDGEIFDWGIEPDSLINAQEMQRNHPQFIETIMKTVTDHFIQSLGDFIGRKISLQEFNEAIEKGYLQ